ncbi:MAG: hypothetical protein EOP50_10005 [Sphingobacteriales bacterium]|nr:MAG: hypothetical protein EOP50_10005 [Sphingobacteriales bacterium]
MRVLFDHNLSPAMARALQELFKHQHEIKALRDKFNPNISDIAWITELSREGRWIIISGDRRITKNRAEHTAFASSKLIGMFLAPGLYKSPVIKQTERLLALWSNIETVSNTVEGGAMFELAISSSKLRQLK